MATESADEPDSGSLLPSTNPVVRRTIDSSILILLGTAISYALAWRYEEGYLGFFGIPWTFAEVSAGSLARAMTILLLPVGLTYLVISIASSEFQTHVGARMPRYMQAGLYIASLALFGRIWFGIKIVFWPCFIAGLFAILVSLLVPAFEGWKRRVSFVTALVKFETSIRTGESGRSIGFSLPLFAGLGALGIAGLAATSAGHQEAHETIQFTVLHGQPDCLVVRIYGDRILCADYDSVQVLANFRVIPIKDSSLVFTREPVGPLNHAARGEFE